MRLVIDFQAVQNASRLRGIGRYSMALVRALLAQARGHEVIIALNDAFPDTIMPIRRALAELVQPGAIRIWSAPRILPDPAQALPEDPAAQARRRRQAEILRESFLTSLAPDAVLVCSLFEGRVDEAVPSVPVEGHGAPVAVILYDLIPLHDLDGFAPKGSARRDHYLDRVSALKRADLLLAISDFTRHDAIDRLDLPEARLVNISGACDAVFRPIDLSGARRDALRTRLGISRDIIVTAGGTEARKNLATLCRAFAHMPTALRAHHQIVCVGRGKPSTTRALADLRSAAGLAEDEVILTGHIPDTDLAALYSAARLMVFPSMNEGFGLPPLEAMSCGTPTLAANATSLPEVVGLSEALFDPTEPQALAALMTEALQDGPLRDLLCRHAAAQARRFSWEESARRTWAALEALTSVPARPPAGPDPLERCIQRLAETGPTAAEMRGLARHLALDFPPPGAARRLLLDRDAQGTADLAAALPAHCRALGVDLLEVATGATPGLVPAGTAQPVDYAPGDLLVVMQGPPERLLMQQEALHAMARRGLRIHALLHDMGTLAAQDRATRLRMHDWLHLVAGFDGVLTRSSVLRQAFDDWCRINAPDAPRAIVLPDSPDAAAQHLAALAGSG